MNPISFFIIIDCSSALCIWIQNVLDEGGKVYVSNVLRKDTCFGQALLYLLIWEFRFFRQDFHEIFLRNFVIGGLFFHGRVNIFSFFPYFLLNSNVYIFLFLLVQENDSFKHFLYSLHELARLNAVVFSKLFLIEELYEKHFQMLLMEQERLICEHID